MRFKLWLYFILVNYLSFSSIQKTRFRITEPQEVMKGFSKSPIYSLFEYKQNINGYFLSALGVFNGIIFQELFLSQIDNLLIIAHNRLAYRSSLDEWAIKGQK
jgi:hypothetical protein